jgi:hypothetical protein
VISLEATRSLTIAVRRKQQSRVSLDRFGHVEPLRPIDVLKRVAAVGGAAALARAIWPAPHARPQLTEEDRRYVTDWVKSEIEPLRARSYEALLKAVDTERHELGQTPSGVEVVRETIVFPDDPDSGNLRVIVDVFFPVTGGGSVASDDFIRSPDGGFVGE